MNKVIPAPRTELNKWAPRIESIQIPKDKIGEVIGPKGKVIRELEEKTGASIEIEEEGGFGLVRIASSDSEALAAAKERIMNIVFPPEAELNKEYDGEVVNITKFGAFVNILPGRDGLLHISKLDDTRRVERVEDYLELGQKIGARRGDRRSTASLPSSWSSPWSARREPAQVSPRAIVLHAVIVEIVEIEATAEIAAETEPIEDRAARVATATGDLVPNGVRPSPPKPAMAGARQSLSRTSSTTSPSPKQSANPGFAAALDADNGP